MRGAGGAGGGDGGAGGADAGRGAHAPPQRCRFVPPLTRCIPGLRAHSVPLFLKRQRGRTLGGQRHGDDHRPARAGDHRNPFAPCRTSSTRQ